MLTVTIAEFNQENAVCLYSIKYLNMNRKVLINGLLIINNDYTMFKAPSHINEQPPTSTCVYLRIGPELNSCQLVCGRRPSLWSSYVCVCERLHPFQ